MLTRFIAIVWLVVAAAAGAADSPPVTIVVLADSGGVDPGPMVEGLRSAAGEGARVTLYRLPRGGTISPIDRGRLLARVQSADLIVTIADRATEFILAERERIPVFFVGAASLVRGQALGSPDVAGILPYNVGHSLDVVKGLGLSPLGLAYTPGFAPVARQIEAEAEARGVPVIRKPVSVRREVGPALRELTRAARVVWVLGDPLLTRGAGYDLLVEEALAADVAVLAPHRQEVEQGALLAFEPEWTSLAGSAVEGVRRRLAGDSTDDPRVISAPATGTFVINRVLGARWKSALPAGVKWRELP